MAHSYLPVDRDQRFLLPPDVREWLPEGHLAWFVLDVVARVDTSVLHARHPNDGVGRRAYDPDMLLGVLVYAYCTGQRSSRQIERLCDVDVAYRVICANHRPDHTTIARFRQHHQDHAQRLFTDVLVLCHAAGLATIGVIAVDGTKIGADASLKANRTRDQIEAEVRAMFDEAATTDAAEDRLFGDTRGDELPAELADPRRRGARLDAALAELDAQRVAADAARDDARSQRAVKEANAAAQGRRLPGRKPKSSDPVADAEAGLEAAREKAAQRRAEIEARAARENRRPKGPAFRGGKGIAEAQARLDAAKQAAAADPDVVDTEALRVNTTDPHSRIMKSPQGWVQGYNAQAGVNDQGVVVAAAVTQDGNDAKQCAPMMAATEAALHAAGVFDPIGMLLFDAGYWSDANATAEGPSRLIATTKDYKQRKAARDLGATVGEPPGDAAPLEAMEHRLRTAEGAALYAKRSVTVEPVFGQVKDGRGFRRFMRRGLHAVDAEWQLICATHNLLKLHRTSITIT
jgi:transposase